MQLLREGRIEVGGEYPSYVERVVEQRCYDTVGKGTYYGICTEPVEVNGRIIINANTVFAIAADRLSIRTVGIHKADMVVWCRYDYHGQDVYGVPVEKSGRLRYADGADTLLIYPPKVGGPCVTYMQFPPGTDQWGQQHPSVRLGLVLRGCGKALLDDRELPLWEGDIFCIEVAELHRFRTDNAEMTIIAYNPDSDWGPTDEVLDMM